MLGVLLSHIAPYFNTMPLLLVLRRPAASNRHRDQITTALQIHSCWCSMQLLSPPLLLLVLLRGTHVSAVLPHGFMLHHSTLPLLVQHAAAVTASAAAAAGAMCMLCWPHGFMLPHSTLPLLVKASSTSGGYCWGTCTQSKHRGMGEGGNQT